MASLYYLKLAHTSLAAGDLEKRAPAGWSSGNQETSVKASSDRLKPTGKKVAISDDRTPPPPRGKPYPSEGELVVDPTKPLDKELDFSFSGWPVRDQGGPENCVAFSAIACFEHWLFGRGAIDKPAFSAQFLIYAIKTDTDDPHKKSGYTYLRWAYEALLHDGACPEVLCPYTGGIELLTPPTTTARKAAKTFDGTIFYRDLLRNDGQMDATRMVYECLRQNKRPVAMSLPVFPADELSTLYETNWTNQAAFHHGLVAEPNLGLTRIGEHCVCITGFIPSQTAGSPGYFVFRNSWGTQWAQYAPSTLPGPTAMAPGYGLVSETYVNRHCKELLQLY